MLSARFARPALQAALVLLVLAALWPFVATSYNQLLATAARLAEGGAGALSTAGWYVVVSPPGAGAHAMVSVHSFALQSGALLVMAVVLATPGWGWPRRSAWAAAALGASFLLQGLALGLFARLYTAYLGDAEVRGSLFAGLTLFWTILPPIVAGLWCLLRWLPQILSTPSPQDDPPTPRSPAESTPPLAS